MPPMERVLCLVWYCAENCVTDFKGCGYKAKRNYNKRFPTSENKVLLLLVLVRIFWKAFKYHGGSCLTTKVVVFANWQQNVSFVSIHLKGITNRCISVITLISDKRD